MYCHVPGYEAIIFRRTFPQLAGANNLISRAREWLIGTPATYNQTQHRWTFPTVDPKRPAHLTFAHMQLESSKHDYQGSEYQFIGFDELTQFTQTQYEYLFTRCRVAQCPYHKKKANPHCERCVEIHKLSVVPLRIRSAGNPGGIGHTWVKKRWKIRNDGNPVPLPDRRFIRATIYDNPGLDRREYVEEFLSQLDPVTREQLLEGRWISGEGTKFKPGWIKRWKVRGEHYVLDGKEYPYRSCTRIMACDLAGTQRERSRQETKGTESKTVITVWDVTPGQDLVLLDAWIGQEEAPDVAEKIVRMSLEWVPMQVGMETDGVGKPIFQYVKRGVSIDGTNRTAPVYPLMTRGRDKLVRFVPFQNHAANGKVYFPDHHETRLWLEDVESELTTWTGHPDEPDDVPDSCAWAGQMVLFPAVGNQPTVGGAITGGSGSRSERKVKQELHSIRGGSGSVLTPKL